MASNLPELLSFLCVAQQWSKAWWHWLQPQSLLRFPRWIVLILVLSCIQCFKTFLSINGFWKKLDYLINDSPSVLIWETSSFFQRYLNNRQKGFLTWIPRIGFFSFRSLQNWFWLWLLLNWFRLWLLQCLVCLWLFGLLQNRFWLRSLQHLFCFWFFWCKC